MLSERLYASAANVFMRGCGIVARFGLAIYLTKVIGIRAVGEFGLIQGAIAMAPAFIGFGLNYYLNREIVDLPLRTSGIMVRDRLIVTIALALLISAIFTGGVFVGFFVTMSAPLLIIAIFALECIASDIHLSLISLRRPLTANFLAFLRSALWVAPVAILGFFDQKYRTLNVVLEGWLLCDLLSFVLLVILTRDLPYRQIFDARVDMTWVARTIRRGWLIYMGDIGIAGQVYFERFVVNYFLGLQMTGIYTLFWSIGNAIFSLVLVAVVQLALPDLVSAYTTGGRTVWFRKLVQETLKAGAIGIGLSLTIGFGTLLTMPSVGISEFSRYWPIFTAILVGVVLRLISQVLNYGFYSRHMDTAFVAFNIGGMVLSIAVGVLAIGLFGLNGIIWSAVLVPAVLALLRGGLLIADWKNINLQRFFGLSLK
jgi:O-antigen/teichoic acid export membrane protein